MREPNCASFAFELEFIVGIVIHRKLFLSEYIVVKKEGTVTIKMIDKLLVKGKGACSIEQKQEV